MKALETRLWKTRPAWFIRCHSMRCEYCIHCIQFLSWFSWQKHTMPFAAHALCLHKGNRAFFRLKHPYENLRASSLSGRHMCPTLEIMAAASHAHMMILCQQQDPYSLAHLLNSWQVHHLWMCSMHIKIPSLVCTQDVM